MNIAQIVKYIITHPLNKDQKIKSILRFLKWQIGIRLNKYPIIYPFIEDTKLIIERGMTGATGNIYTGLHELNEMAFLLHFLKEKDIFIDIGANIGSYTILASGVKKANTISIEPVPSTFTYLLNNININNLSYLVSSLNIGLGSEKSILKFTKLLDSVNHVVSKGEIVSETIDVTIEKLDDIIKECPLLIKMDVEGFEHEVLKGATNTLSNKKLQAIIIELNGSGNRYGFSDEDVHKILLKNNFIPYTYDPFKRELKVYSKKKEVNAIYIRDLKFVKERVEKAEKVSVLNHLI